MVNGCDVGFYLSCLVLYIDIFYCYVGEFVEIVEIVYGVCLGECEGVLNIGL